MTTKKSTVISFRLNPANKTDKEALEIIERLQERGFSARAIVTDAILRADGHTPEMYDNADTVITRHLIESLLSEFAQEIITELRHTQSQPSGDKKPFDEGEDDDEYSRNLANGFLARRKRGQGSS